MQVWHERSVADGVARSKTVEMTKAIPVLNLGCPRGRRFA
jgi:hypothetical protein